jgi:ActR/RegA family two-component response regulator
MAANTGAKSGGSASAGSTAADSAAQQVQEGVEATLARIRELNERAMEAARAAGTASLDAYEKALQSFVSVEERLAQASQLDWVKAIVGAQAEFVQNISGVYVNAARDLLKQ